MIRASVCPIACSAVTPSSSSAAWFHDVIYPWLSVVTIASWNHAAELLLGVTAEQAIGQTLALIIPEALRPRHAACFRAAMNNGQLSHGGQPARVEAITPGGDVMPLALTLGLLAGPDSAPAGAVAVLRRADASLVPFGNPAGQSGQ